MSWEQYNNMFDNAQVTGEYHLFVFDKQNSRKTRYNTDVYMIRDALISRIKELEIILGRKILHLPYEEERGGYRDGILGDLFSVVIYKGALEANEMYKIFTEEKEKLNIQSKFHFDDCYYETDRWVLGDKLYYREYAIAYLDKRAKNKKDVI
jgi:hypothetical protein